MGVLSDLIRDVDKRDYDRERPNKLADGSEVLKSHVSGAAPPPNGSAFSGQRQR
jgi:hypothetical protein